ncbi:hypothetical protein AUC71_07060 [Methyloceanibacter marginalis]|uniref:Rv2525c-like glycoside hydrolase-like domain-containing protein n=1 Tax=Methyloceanibacter marginalis TaxID=1774971 RepID=A0A1E3WDL7_9HYPH|nr:glycoside hydrolase domain-containing protein [Methyloceanibacter marginalis]ODS03909.1 hypothetical protein AUC71_07060 [Methyloceanibacter marginalis]
MEGQAAHRHGRAGQPGSEIDAILDHGFAVLSIYQYLSSSKYKFEGKSFDSKGKLFTLKDANCARPANPPHSTKTEAELDSRAAVAQARALGQPSSTAIYFGVDFNFDRSDTATAKKMVEYFTVVNRNLREAGYLVGAYGSGDALMLLQRQRLITSPGFPRRGRSGDRRPSIIPGSGICFRTGPIPRGSRARQAASAGAGSRSIPTSRMPPSPANRSASGPERDRMRCPRRGPRRSTISGASPAMAMR